MKQINISQVDTLFVNGSYPIELLLFYNYKLSKSSIRKALKGLSSSFWPLFGNYLKGSIYSSKYMEDKFYSETVLDQDFIPAKDEMEIWEKYKLVNPPKMEGLFFLSIIQFNNGTVVIPKMNHLVGDGYSYFYFLSILAAVSKLSYLPFSKYIIRRLASPKLNRTVLKEFLFNRTEINEPFVHKDCEIKIEKVSRSFVIQEIKKIKTYFNQSVSTNDILAALVVKKTYEKQKAQIKNTFTLSIPIDIRRQVKEFGQKFFGNGLVFHHLTLKIDELDTMDCNELAVKLRKSIPLVDTLKYLEYLNDLEGESNRAPVHSLKTYDPTKGCLVTNLSRMPVQKLNFGSGPPEFIFPLTIGKNSAAILADKNDYLLRLVY